MNKWIRHLIFAALLISWVLTQVSCFLSRTGALNPETTTLSYVVLQDDFDEDPDDATELCWNSFPTLIAFERHPDYLEEFLEKSIFHPKDIYLAEEPRPPRT